MLHNTFVLSTSIFGLLKGSLLFLKIILKHFCSDLSLELPVGTPIFWEELSPVPGHGVHV